MARRTTVRRTTLLSAYVHPAAGPMPPARRQRRLPAREIGGGQMRIGLLTEGGYPYADGEGGLWCDRLVRGLAPHEFDLYALSRTASQEESGWVPLPPEIHRVRTA